MASNSCLGCILFLLCTIAVYSDTPANCTYEDIRGTWMFYEGERDSVFLPDCSDFSGPPAYELVFELLVPDVVIDRHGNVGHWTVIYNQGFEVVINYRKYFAFSKYEDSGQVTSYCDLIIPGWSHDVLGKNWACYNAKKVYPKTQPKHYRNKKGLLKRRHIENPSFVQSINIIQNSWTASTYDELRNVPFKKLMMRSGGPKSRIYSPPSPAPIMPPYLDLAAQLPKEFDWRNVNGVNFVSPVRNQGHCGSCYAFSALSMLESRLRIATNNTLRVQFSPQDVVSCSKYSQGCDGGFPYLIAGKYGQDFGVVTEDCNPYVGKEIACMEQKCKRYYVADYKYIGGFYGGCNEPMMRLDLVKNGPLSMAFALHSDFQQYKSGIYHHTGLRDSFNPLMVTDHAGLITGYGDDENTGEKYWTVKNSWGTEWGENGYFRIRRGTNECNVESIAVSAIPIP